jgi:L-threonylcarbamoyladenylate synthase
MTSLIDKAALFIKAGKIVAFPTETVYGLGADATNDQACQKIFQIKGRPSLNPLIVHIASIQQAENIGEFNDDARKLANAFWPGPLSIVVPLKSNASIVQSVLAGLTTIALRLPSNNIALELIRKSGVPIAAPSANPSGYVSATTQNHVEEHFLHEKDVFILGDELKSQYGIESTIVDTTSSNLNILRSGFITVQAIEEILGKKIGASPSLMQIKAPGMMDKHYSPKVKVRLNATNILPNEVSLNFADSQLAGKFSLNLSKVGDLIEAATNLYLNLRLLDNYAELNKISTINIAPIPNIGIGVAINDRLQRAAKE